MIAFEEAFANGGEPTTYVPGSFQNPDYKISNNQAKQNQFAGAKVDIQASVNQEGVTIQVEKEPETVYKYTTERTVIVNDSPSEVENQKVDKDSKTFLIPVAISFVMVVMIVICIRQVMIKQEKGDQETAMRIRNMNDQELSECKSNVVDLGGAIKSNDYDSVNRDSKAYTFDVSMKGAGQEDYAAQYDPNNDYAIFGVGDPSRGGVQSMKEKMNLADEIAENDSDEPSPRNAAKNDGHVTLPQISDSKNTNAKFIIDDNDMPENKEIESDLEQD